MKTIYNLMVYTVLLCCASVNYTSAQSIETDSLALVDLYNECGGSGWTGFDNWLNGPLNTWEEVTVDSATQRVTHVEFSGMTLIGTLPASIGNLDKMSGKIQLNNQEGLIGELPASVWNWVGVDRFQLKFTGVTSIDYTGMENMVNLTEFNCENTPLSGMIPGILFTLPAMEKLYLHDSEFDALPAEFTSVSGLDRLYLNGNNITDLPDMSGIVWKAGAKVRVQNNLLTFEDLESNVVLSSDTLVSEFAYSPQGKVGEETTLYPEAGSKVELVANIGGSANIYTWIKGEDQVGDTDTFTIAAFDDTIDSGTYFALAQNAGVPGLDIFTANTILQINPFITDSLALVDLYNECGGSGWTGFDNWLNGPLNTWEEVTVDSATQRVTHVEFSGMTLIGTLPASIGNLDKMSGKIQLNNQEGLIGELPASVWNWVGVDRFQLKFTGVTSIDYTGMENMVNLTEFNCENTPLSGMVPGILFTLPAMEKLYLHDSEFDALPAEFTSVSGLDRLYLNGNNITDLPDMSGIVWKAGAKVRVQNNLLTFEDLESNVVLSSDTLVSEFAYSPQGTVGEETTLYPEAGSKVELVANIGGSGNIYTWIKGEDQVGDTDTFTIAAFDGTIDSGTYFALAQNAGVPGLDIFTANTILQINPFITDSLALVDLYNECGGSGWTGFDNWLNGPLNTWEEVTVDSATQRVTHVEFSGMTLTGTLPASIGNLDKMSGKIQLNNQEGLIGELPASVWNWVGVDRFQLKFTGVTSIDYTGMENMVNLTEFNCENTPLSGMVPGILFTLPAMEKLYLHDSEFDALPAEFTSVSGLDRLYLNGNNITDLPDMSGIVWKEGAKVRVQNNLLTFEDLESNVVLSSDPLVSEFAYSPQGIVGEETSITPAAGSKVELVANVGGTANVYTWVKGEDQVGDMDTFTIASFDETVDAGTYFALVQNTTVTGLDIMTANTILNGMPSPFTMDSLALVDLYNECGGSGWTGFGNWLNGPLNTWEEVTVDSATQRVTHVEFSGMTLIGTLPASIGNLDKMSGKIQLNNQEGLIGELPASVWNWVGVDRFQLKFTGVTSIDYTGMENMVNLTEFNCENTPLSGMVPGILFTLPAMEKLYLHDSEFDALPAEFTSVSGLDRLYLNGNNITDLPDMSGIIWKEGAKVRVQNNLLTFEDLESNVVLSSDPLVSEFAYSPQAKVGEILQITAGQGAEINLVANVGGTANIYTWIKGEEQVGDMDSFTIASFDKEVDSGVYFAIVQNTTVTGLDIMTENITIQGPVINSDSLALVDLYNECGGTGWTGFDHWLNGPLNTWEAVTVDSVSKRVTHVEFSGMTLTGSLPLSLGDLDQMSGKIQLNNQEGLIGELPAAVWNWVGVDRFQLKFTGITTIDYAGMEKMVNLTEFNCENTPLSGMVPGILFTLPAMEKLYLHDSEFDALPPEFTSVSGLDRLYLNGNKLSDLPDMSGIVWKAGAKVRVQDNFLTFEDLESNVVLNSDTLVSEFAYSPQANIGSLESIDLNTGDTLRLSAVIGGSANIYTWIIGEDMVIDGAVESTYQNDSVTVDDAGEYKVLVQSELVPGLDIFSESVFVNVTPPSGLEEIDFIGLKILGNPFGENVVITSDEAIQNVYLYNLDGKLINQRSNINANTITMNASGLNAGIYLLVVSNNTKYQTIKLVKK